MSSSTLAPPKKRKLAVVRERPAPEHALAIWEIWARPKGSTQDARPFPSLQNAYRFTDPADAPPTLRSLENGGSGSLPLEAGLRYVVWPTALKLTEVYCEACKIQTGNYTSAKAERRFVSACKDCAYTRRKPWKTEGWK